MAERPRSEPKFEFIDAARGIAILLVLVCHTAVSQQPWPIRRFTELGWHGVQLFFVVSSMTLALSWQYRRDEEVYPFLNFLVRRVFRIWPMYCLAYLAYLVIWPPTMPLSIARVLAALTFMSGWSPGPLPVTETWGGVPGGWSVEDEFAFYLLFPLLIWIAATPLRAILLVVVSLVVAGACNSFSYGHYVATYGNSVTDQWMYYSFPNQLPVFALGFVAYHAFIRLQPRGRLGLPAGASAAIVPTTYHNRDGDVPLTGPDASATSIDAVASNTAGTHFGWDRVRPWRGGHRSPAVPGDC